MKKSPVVQNFVVGPIETNCYVISDPSTGEACLIDPGADPKIIKDYISKSGLDLKFIINTHGHGDHIAANGAFDVPIYIHSLDSDFLTNPGLNLSKMFMFGITSPKASKLLKDGDVLKLGGLELEILHTPGHTPGSVSVKSGGTVFTGDALFAGGIGRTDFAYGDTDLLMRSIAEKLFSLDDSTRIYPGHGPESTIGVEKSSNPFFG
jgi:glyoxylase-like metal-dependent hydrolase (beta-lactamase superfamily II)